MFNANRIARAGACASLAAVVLGSACTSTGDGPQGDPSGSSTPPALTSVTGDGVTATFYATVEPDGHRTIAISEQGSAYATSSPVATLIAQSLTSQEIYLTLGGPGAVAPSQLVDAQAAEAAALGRSAALRPGVLDAGPPVVADLAGCQGILGSWNISSSVGAGSWVAGPGNGSTTCASETELDSAGTVGIGACNDGSGTLSVNQIIYPDWNLGHTLQAFATTLTANEYVLWFWTYNHAGTCTKQGNRCVGQCASSTPGGFGCLAQTVGATYDLYYTTCGPSSLVSAYWVPSTMQPR